jgi:hypothetical protein
MRFLLSLLLGVAGVVSQSASQTVPQGVGPNEADEVLSQLSRLHLDKKQIYHVRDITIRRDALSISLNRGLIAFLEPVRDRVTGAVFLGSGEIVAIPPDPMEKQQIYKFTGSPLLNDTFQTGIFRFTDSTFDEIKAELAQHAEEEVTADDTAQFDMWDQTIVERSRVLNFRLLADLLESPPQPVFIAELNGERTGWFEIVFDRRLVEEIAAFKIQDVANTSVIDLWTSFNQRSESRNPEAFAHENKYPLDILSYNVNANVAPDARADITATMRVKGRTNGARVLSFDLSRSLRLSAVSFESGEPVAFYQSPDVDAVTVVLPQPLRAGQELSLRFAYAGPANAEQWYPGHRYQEAVTFNVATNVPDENNSSPAVKYFSEALGGLNSYRRVHLVNAEVEDIARQWFGYRVAPAGYHDEWLFEGLARYMAAMYIETGTNGAERFREALANARAQSVENDSAGAVWLGPRLASTATPTGYRAVQNKGLWVVHMLRSLMREDGPNPDARFLNMLREFVGTYQGKTASTWDFKHLAEKYVTPALDLRRDKKLDWFFDEWVFATGIPKNTLDYTVEPEGNAFIVTGTITQAGVPDDFIMPIPLFADGTLLGRVLVGDTEGEFRFKVEKKPERILIDPRGEVLASQ